ncbi:hypothetical protein O6H91_18G001200 [Diphasiastrum complanatum]|uniref:Uncharacterized protein n=1 Tax=Diphasiastrum complanatum TaxID=34168 RepID=A0ACC2AYR5_DIPCM|nr:hypothetical protein O6H91_18G001200 [Diphasiastrum complanatum]
MFKDMVLKASLAYRQCKPGSSAIFNDDPANFDEFITSGLKSGKRQYQFGSARSISGQGAASPRSKKSQESNFSHAKVPRHSDNSSTDNQQLASEKPSVGDGAGQEWVAQVEPGVLITFLTLANGGNELRRIRFSREVFDNMQAEAWWTANREKVHELYNVSGREKLPAAFPSPHSSKEVKSINEFGIGASPVISPRLVGDTTAKLNAEPTQSSNTQNPGSNDIKNGADALSADNASGSGSEQVTEDDPGVYVTVKVLPGGSKVLKRVRFSCDRFTERQAKLWWDKNRFRIHEQYVREPTRGTSFRSM